MCSALLLSLMLSGCGKEQSIEVTGIQEADVTEETAEGPAPSKEPETAAPAIVVYVRGAVKKPGVYRLPDGSRVYEAIGAAGGFSPDADQEWLNQAELLADGEMLTVSTLEETSKFKAAGDGQTQGASAAGSTDQKVISGKAGVSSGEGLLNLNSATKDQLMTLPGIGEAKADAIIRYREENGPFASPEDVMNISGIKDSVYSKIKDRITV